jgi:hypothetical protein
METLNYQIVRIDENGKHVVGDNLYNKYYTFEDAEHDASNLRHFHPNVEYIVTPISRRRRTSGRSKN